MNGYVRGAAVPAADRAPDPTLVERAGLAAELSLTMALLTARPPDPDDTEAEFEFDLARVLDGVEAHMAPGGA